MKFLPHLLAAACLLTACPPPGGSSTSSSSSSSGGGGNGASSSSSGGGNGSSSSSGGVTGQPIPLDELCPALARGYLRYGSVLSLSLAAEAFVGSCNPAVSDDELLEMLHGDVQQLVSALCAPDGGVVRTTYEDLLRAEASGRILYDPQAAGSCAAEGRTMLGAFGGIPGLVGGRDGGVVDAAVAQVCGFAVVGTQALGAACQRDVECMPHDAGVVCNARQGQSCEGTCMRLGLPGDECESGGRPECSDDNVCLRPGDRSRGVCAAPALPNAPCAVDGGELNCEQGYICRGGVCRLPFTNGTGCSSTDECEEGLTCTGTPPRCTPPPMPVQVGEVCLSDTVDVPCVPCTACWRRPDSDAGVSRCVVPAKEDEDCTSAPCEFGLLCVNGTCEGLVRRGQPCVFGDFPDVDDTLRGNCLSADDTCVGDPATCQARGEEGASCTAPAVPTSVRGSCAADLVCARSSADATTGTCRKAGALGEACGNQFSVHPDCEHPTANTDCTASEDGGVGTCYATTRGGPSAPCRTNYACEDGLYCHFGDGGDLGQCTPGGALGDECGTSQPHGSTCREGRCESLGADGGFTRRCTPFVVVGGACDFDSECGPGARCLDGLCAPGVAEGGACTSSSDCALGLDCNDGLCLPPACDSGLTAGGASCADGNWIPTLLLFSAVLLGPGRRLARRRG